MLETRCFSAECRSLFDELGGDDRGLNDVKPDEGDGMGGGFYGDTCEICRAVGDFDNVGHHGLVTVDNVPNVAGAGMCVVSKI